MTIYTDGSCLRNPDGPGAFAVICVDTQEEYAEYFPSTTNNRMEMLAIIYAVEHYCKPELFYIPTIYTDSNYALSTFTTWMYSWERNGWKRPKNQPVENLDLVQRYWNLMQNGYKANLQKVKGHNGIEYNEKADKLAKQAVKECRNIYNGNKT